MGSNYLGKAMGKWALLCVTKVALVTVLVLTSGFMIMKAESQFYWFYPDVIINPISPTVADNINVTVEVSFNTYPPFVDEFGPLVQEGNTFFVNLTVYVPAPSDIVLFVLHTDSYTYNLDELDVGAYEFTALIYSIVYEGMPLGGSQVNFNVTSNPYPADVNHDRKVDVFDLVLCASSYGATPIDPHWNIECDIAEPYDIIDILDLVTIASHYGEEYTP